MINSTAYYNDFWNEMSLEMFYLSYSEAVDYCRQSGYMTQK